jgi:hypothetical protein
MFYRSIMFRNVIYARFSVEPVIVDLIGTNEEN